jgi:hypothetical protein
VNLGLPSSTAGGWIAGHPAEKVSTRVGFGKEPSLGIPVSALEEVNGPAASGPLHAEGFVCYAAVEAVGRASDAAGIEDSAQFVAVHTADGAFPRSA